MYDFVVDADSHIMEPAELWSGYVSQSQNELALSIREFPEQVQGLTARRPFICFGDRKLFAVCGSTPAGIQAFEKAANFAKNHSEKAKDQRARYLAIRDALFGYEGQTPLPGRAGHARLEWMRDQGISHSLIFPTWGSMWERYFHDRPDVIAANMGAYNRWVLDFCSSDRRRLLPVCQVSPNALPWALEELRFLASKGVRAILLRPVLYGGVPLSHEKFDQLWRAISDHDFAVYFHVSGMGRGDHDFFEAGWYGDEERGQHNGAIWGASVHVPLLLTLTAMIRDQLFDRFPSLHLASAEHGFRWIEPWLEECDERYSISVARGFLPPCKTTPSELIRKHVWFAGAHGRDLEAAKRSGMLNRVMFSSDFPHPECGRSPVAEFLADASTLPTAAVSKLLGRNCEELLRVELAA